MRKKDTSAGNTYAGESVKKRGYWNSALRRYGKNKLAVLGLVIFLFLLFMALTAGIFFDYETQALGQNVQERFLTPCLEHPFGTDNLGRDMFVRIVFGARISLLVAVVVAVGSLAIGTVIGAIAGFYGGKIDEVLMRIMDVFMAIPSMLLAICIVAALGNSLTNLIIANVVAHVPRFSRLVRSCVLSLKGSEYIEAARLNGAGDKDIILRHILPNSIGTLIVQATLTMAHAILTVASLSFVGLGIQAPTPEWGTMLSAGKEYMRLYPNLVIVPGLAITFAVLSFNLMGDGLRDALDPRLKN